MTGLGLVGAGSGGGPSVGDLVAVEVDEITGLLLEVAVTEASFAWYCSPSGSAESVLLAAVEALVEHRLFDSRGAAPHRKSLPPGGAAPCCPGVAVALFDGDGVGV